VPLAGDRRVDRDAYGRWFVPITFKESPYFSFLFLTSRDVVRAAIFVTVHYDEVGEERYDDRRERYIDTVAVGLTAEG